MVGAGHIIKPTCGIESVTRPSFGMKPIFIMKSVTRLSFEMEFPSFALYFSLII